MNSRRTTQEATPFSFEIEASIDTLRCPRAAIRHREGLPHVRAYVCFCFWCNTKHLFDTLQTFSDAYELLDGMPSAPLPDQRKLSFGEENTAPTSCATQTSKRKAAQLRSFLWATTSMRVRSTTCFLTDKMSVLRINPSFDFDFLLMMLLRVYVLSDKSIAATNPICGVLARTDDRPHATRRGEPLSLHRLQRVQRRRTADHCGSSPHSIAQ